MKQYANRRAIAILGGLLAVGTAAAGQPGGHGFHPPMPGERYYLRCRVGSTEPPVVSETAIELPSLTAPASFNQRVELPGGAGHVRLLQYLPRASLVQEARPTAQAAGHALVQISVDGPTQSYQRWLVADDLDRNRLISLIGTWRYMTTGAAQRDVLWKQFREELHRDPVLRVTARDGGRTFSLPAVAGQSLAIAKPDCKIFVREFYPHFAMDKASQKPINRSQKRLNPAALVDVEHHGTRRQLWVFAKFPDFSMDQAAEMPVRLMLNCPQDRDSEKPDFVILSLPGGKNEVWMRYGGKVSSRPAVLKQRFEVEGSQYTFCLREQVARGVLQESYAPTAHKGGVPALRFELGDATGVVRSSWLEFGKALTMQGKAGVMTLTFGPPRRPAAGVHP